MIERPAISSLPLVWMLGFRYLSSSSRTRQDRFISFIALTSVLGIALGVWALIVVVSVMNGFQRDVRDRMLSVVAHAEIISSTGQMEAWSDILQRAKQNPEVLAGAPYISSQALLMNDIGMNGVVVQGILPELEQEVLSIPVNGRLKDLEAGTFRVILGIHLARALQVRVGDKVTLAVPQGNVTPAGVIPRVKQFQVVGLLHTGHYEYDSSLAYIHIEDAKRVFRLGGQAGIRLKLRDLQRAPEVVNDLAKTLPSGLILRDWGQVNRIWFTAVQIEKRMMFIILGLIIMVAAFNLVSTLVMMVNDKRADIAILRTLGARPQQILSIFIITGASSGVLGAITGTILGVITAWNVGTWVATVEAWLGIQILAQETYFISQLPSDLRWLDVAWTLLIATSLSFLATFYPSWRASHLSPTEALRHE